MGLDVFFFVIVVDVLGFIEFLVGEEVFLLFLSVVEVLNMFKIFLISIDLGIINEVLRVFVDSGVGVVEEKIN